MHVYVLYVCIVSSFRYRMCVAVLSSYVVIYVYVCIVVEVLKDLAKKHIYQT